jgi:hypothetical protein
MRVPWRVALASQSEGRRADPGNRQQYYQQHFLTVLQLTRNTIMASPRIAAYRQEPQTASPKVRDFSLFGETARHKQAETSEL